MTAFLKKATAFKKNAVIFQICHPERSEGSRKRTHVVIEILRYALNDIMSCPDIG